VTQCFIFLQDGEPCKVGVAMTDLSTGLYAHGAIMAALLDRHKSGLGQHIDCNLFSTQVGCSPFLNHQNVCTRIRSAFVVATFFLEVFFFFFYNS
jgi:crotonobetainyl-CoA:carnitine CoA-transferase CaiB-like acyl-CoA transferase